MLRGMRILTTLMVAVMSLVVFSGGAEAAVVGTRMQAKLTASAAFPTASATVLYQMKNGVAQMTVQVSGVALPAGTELKLEQGDLLPPAANLVLGAGGKGKVTLQGAAVPALAQGTALSLKANQGRLIATGVIQ